jgi:hypothetical protein
MSVKGSWSRVQNKEAYDATMDNIRWSGRHKAKDMKMSEVVEKLTNRSNLKGPGSKLKETK